MSRRGAQVIVLAHDSTYLRDVRQVFSKKKNDNYNAPRTSTELQLKRPSSNNSMLLAADLDRECDSTYFCHYRRLRLFVFGESEDGALVEHIVAAKTVRPLVEGYLHRRFPGRVPEKPLGAVIVEINQSTAPDVLLHAKSLVPELSESNGWAIGLHQDTQLNYAGQSPDPHEAVAFALELNSCQ